MTTVQGPYTFDQALAWIKAHPTKHQGGPWAVGGNSWCEQLMNNACGFGADAFTSAALAGSNSGGLDPDPATAKPGEFVYWTNHVGMVTRQGWMICATTKAVADGHPSGIMEISFDDYSRAFPNQHWRGHSPRHGSHVLRKVVPPVPKPAPVPVPVPTPAPTPIPPSHNKGKSLERGEVLAVGDYLQNGTFKLTMKDNSILTLTDGAKLVWNTSRKNVLKVGDHTKTYATLQGDGNFVVYGFDKKGKKFAIYASGTVDGKYATAGEHVSLQANGHLYVQPAVGAGKTIVAAK